MRCETGLEFWQPWYLLTFLLIKIYYFFSISGIEGYTSCQVIIQGTLTLYIISLLPTLASNEVLEVHDE